MADNVQTSWMDSLGAFVKRATKDLGGGIHLPKTMLVDASGNAIGSAAAPLPTKLQLGNASRSYIAWGTGYAGYSNPTALISLQGSDTKIVRPNTFTLRIQSTSATLIRLDWWKRAANTGGTKAAATAIKMDSGDAAASAVVETYSVIPSGLGAGDKIASIQALRPRR